MELKDYLETNKTAVLNLGCGRICPPSHFGIDAEDHDGVDMVCDLTNGIPIDDNTFDTVWAKDFLEHIPQGEPCIKMMEEIYRVLKPGGSLHLDVPSTDGGGIGAFGHPQHVSWWSKTTIKYYLDDEYTGGWRASIGAKCHFIPISILTYWNDHNMPYVDAELKKKD